MGPEATKAAFESHMQPKATLGRLLMYAAEANKALYFMHDLLQEFSLHIPFGPRCNILGATEHVCILVWRKVFLSLIFRQVQQTKKESLNGTSKIPALKKEESYCNSNSNSRKGA